MIFNLKLQNRIRRIIQLLKPNKFEPLSGFKGGFSLYGNLKHSTTFETTKGPNLSGFDS